MPVTRPLLTVVLAALIAAPALPALSASAQPTAPLGGGVPLVAAAPAGGNVLGYDRLGVRRGDTWVLSSSLDGSGVRSYVEQTPGWQPVAGDTDGDGNDSVSLFRDGVWLIRDVEGGPARTIRFGLKGDQPVMGDWNGDGVDSLGLFRRGRWYVKDTLVSPYRSFGYGLPGDVAVVGDWDANGRTDIGVRRNTTWFQRDAANSGATSRSFTFGNSGDRPVAGDWDHDGRDTPGVFRNGTWFLRRGSFPSPYQTVFLGRTGDVPVVRRTQGLAPGVTHDVVNDPTGPWVAHVATVDLAAASSPETVLASGRLAGTEQVSAMTRRAGAVLGVNGDFFLGSGRPVHLFANDGRLIQSPTTLGRAFSLDASGTKFAMGYPDLRTTLTTTVATGTASVNVPRTNFGTAGGSALSAFNAFGGSLETPPADRCYASLIPGGGRRMRADGAVDQPVTISGTRCGGAAPVVSGTTTFLTADPFTSGGDLIRSFAKGQPATLSTQLGFPGAVDTLGGNPLLVVNGSVVASEVDGSGPFFDRAPRTAVGYTREGQLLIVVVDGRQSGYSRGMTLRELAELMQYLGATQAINLDGGGSSVMVVNGLVASRPTESRPVGNALVVLPGGDAGQGDLTPGTAPAGLRSSAYGPAALDPASAGGLADLLAREGVPMAPELRRTAGIFRASR